MYRIDIMTLFDLTVGDVLSESILGRAQERGYIKIETHQIRDYTLNKQKQVDDYPYGGGRGAVLQADPLYQCWKHICEVTGSARPHTIYLSPCGKTFTQKEAVRLARDYDHLVLVCGHYEGVDQRFLDAYVDEELSLGDFVLTGGEIPAMAVTDAVCRMVPGVLPDPECYEDESHFNGLLEYPQYSRPEVWQGMRVPEALLTGDHKSVERWRRKEALLRTKARRPDMFAAYRPQGKLDEEVFAQIAREERVAALKEPLVCRPAEEDDLPAIMDIIAQAVDKLARERIDQWQGGYPDEGAIRADIARGEGYVLTYGDKVVACFTLSAGPEPCYDGLTDGKWRSNAGYMVVHRCAVAGEMRGLCVSDAMLREAETLALAQGVCWMRVDTHRKNRAMQNLLRRNGYEYRGNVLVSPPEGHDPRRVAFEKALRPHEPRETFPTNNP